MFGITVRDQLRTTFNCACGTIFEEEPGRMDQFLALTLQVPEGSEVGIEDLAEQFCATSDEMEAIPICTLLCPLSPPVRIELQTNYYESSSPPIRL